MTMLAQWLYRLDQGLISAAGFGHESEGDDTVMVTSISRDLARATLAVLFIAGMIVASFWVLRPFLPAVVWATMIVVATWPLMLRVQSALWGRRWLAVTVMTITLLLVFVVPFSLAIGTIVAHADEITGWTRSLGTLKLPAPPDWL